MGRERTNHLASYWSVDDREKRLDILMNAKNGGSMTPEVLKELEKVLRVVFCSTEGVGRRYCKWCSIVLKVSEECIGSGTL